MKKKICLLLTAGLILSSLPTMNVNAAGNKNGWDNPNNPHYGGPQIPQPTPQPMPPQPTPTPQPVQPSPEPVQPSPEPVQPAETEVEESEAPVESVEESEESEAPVESVEESIEESEEFEESEEIEESIDESIEETDEIYEESEPMIEESEEESIEESVEETTEEPVEESTEEVEEENSYTEELELKGIYVLKVDVDTTKVDITTSSSSTYWNTIIYTGPIKVVLNINGDIKVVKDTQDEVERFGTVSDIEQDSFATAFNKAVTGDEEDDDYTWEYQKLINEKDGWHLDITAYVPTYAVSFVTNMEGVEVNATRVMKNEKITEPDVSADGYSLDGWFTDSTFTQQYNFDTRIKNGYTLYAKWSEVPVEETEESESIEESEPVDETDESIEETEESETIEESEPVEETDETEETDIDDEEETEETEPDEIQPTPTPAPIVVNNNPGPSGQPQPTEGVNNGTSNNPAPISMPVEEVNVIQQQQQPTGQRVRVNNNTVTIQDEATPLAGTAEDEIEIARAGNEEPEMVVIDDEDTPLEAEIQLEESQTSAAAGCWIHWLMAILTLLFVIYKFVLNRSPKNNNTEDAELSGGNKKGRKEKFTNLAIVIVLGALGYCFGKCILDVYVFAVCLGLSLGELIAQKNTKEE